MMDEFTWAHMWAATKAEVSDAIDKGKKLEGCNLDGVETGTDKYYQACADRITYVIDRTQVYDSVFSRAEWMRSKDTGVAVATAFMAEPLTSLNMLYSATISGSKKKIAKAVGAYFVATALNTTLKSIITTMRHRDKDDEDSLLEDYLREWLGNFIDEIFIGNLIPYVGDIVDSIKGYDSERMDTQVFSEGVAVITAIANDKPTSEVIDKALNFIGMMKGIPYKNLKKDITGFYNTVMSIKNGTAGGTTAEGLKEALNDAIDEATPIEKNTERGPSISL